MNSNCNRSRQQKTIRPNGKRAAAAFTVAMHLLSGKGIASVLAKCYPWQKVQMLDTSTSLLLETASETNPAGKL